MKKKIVSALLTATMVCGMSVVPAVGVAAADDTITVGFSQVGAESDCFFRTMEIIGKNLDDILKENA